MNNIIVDIKMPEYPSLFPEHPNIFWSMVNFFINPWPNDETPEGDFISWYCSHEEFRESAIKDLVEQLDNPNLTIDQKAKISKALLTTI